MGQRRGAFVALGLGLLVASSGCVELGEVLGDSQGLARAGEEVVGLLAAASVGLAGVMPTAGYRDSGNIELSLLPLASNGAVALGNLQAAGMRVAVENEDGSLSECEPIEREPRQACQENLLTILLDSSGSMELAYPPAEYGDVCLSCPHDPERRRVDAARRLARVLLEESPRTQISVADFGPDADPGFDATRLLTDYTHGLGAIHEGIDLVEGYEREGTPLWDALAETIRATGEAADLMEQGGDPGSEDQNWEEREPGEVHDRLDQVGRHIVLLTDGQDTESDRENLDSVLRLAEQYQVSIYVVGLGEAAVTGDGGAVLALQRLARDSGGFYASADDARGLERLFELTARALAHGYQVEEYRCVPRPSEDVPWEEVEPPAAGSIVRGNVELGGQRLPWTFLAP